MPNSDLFLWFPQWQGSGIVDDIFRGATALYEHLNTRLDFIHVSISGQSATPSIEQDDCIINHPQLLEHLHESRRILSSRQPQRIFTLGGDCGIELAPISYLNNLFGGKIAIVWIDAHADLNTPASSPSKTFHGMILRALLGGCGEADIMSESLPRALEPSQVILVGVRDLDPPEEDYIRENQIAMIGCEDLQKSGGKAIVDLARDRGFDKVYLHIDADVLDPQIFNSVMCPTPGGIDMATLRRIVEDIRVSLSIIGGSLVEVTAPATSQNQALEDISDVFYSLHS